MFETPKSEQLSKPENRAPERETGLDKSYRDEADIEGAKFSVVWDSRYDDYVISFPGVIIDDYSRRMGVGDNAVRIGQDPEKAKAVFSFVKEAAKHEGPNVLNLCRKAQEYIKQNS